MIKAQQFNQVSGMNMDISPSKRPSTVAYKIKNMRITIEGDGHSLMSWSNEKGTEELFVKDTSGNDFTLIGNVKGTCLLNNQLILLSYVSDIEDRIYQLDFSNPTYPIGKTLYTGNLGFDKDIKIETLAVYENEEILKVYWTDGINQPRFINIAGTIVPENFDTQFDFLPTDNSDKTTEITITKRYETGYFKAGTIQYLFVYYNINGAQSNIFYVSPILYISYPGVGTLTDKSVSNSFKITIENPNPHFDYIRIYSISRASTDTDPSANLIKDLPIKTSSTEDDTIADTIEFIDNGDTNTSIDYNELLFMNNSPISASTFDLKDNTLFLGDIDYKTVNDQTLVEAFSSNLNERSAENVVTFKHVKIISNQEDSSYIYTNQLDKSANEITGFKGGEWYLFGFMLLDNQDRWTSVIPIGGALNTVYPKVEKEEDVYNTYIVKAVISNDYIARILKYLNQTFPNQYKAIKFVTVSKNEGQRNVVCQGIVNPTVYCYENRINNVAPFALSSWFFRPIMRKAPYDYTELQGTGNFGWNANKGGVLEFRHYAPLSSVRKDSGLASFNNGEIQSQPICEAGTGLCNLKLISNDLKNNTHLSNQRCRFGVDSSIVTFHSPEVEFNDTILGILDKRTDLKFRIIGYTKVLNTLSDYKILCEDSSFIDADYSHYYENTLNLNKQQKSSVPAAGLVNTFGSSIKLYYLDNGDLDEESTVEEYLKAALFEETGLYTYNLIFPWHRSNSVTELITPVISKSVSYDWKIPIKTKVMSNLRICMDTYYADSKNTDLESWEPENGISELLVYNTNKQLIRIPNTKSLEESYYGEIDTLLTNERYSAYFYGRFHTPNSYIGQVGVVEEDIGYYYANSTVLGYYSTNPVYIFNNFTNPGAEAWWKDKNNSPWSHYTYIDRGLDYDNATNKSLAYYSDPIRMKYKSTDHIVFEFTPDEEEQIILPLLTALTAPSYYTTPEWELTDTIDSETGETIKTLPVFYTDQFTPEGMEKVFYTDIYAYFHEKLKYDEVSVEYPELGDFIIMVSTVDEGNFIFLYGRITLFVLEEEGPSYYRFAWFDDLGADIIKESVFIQEDDEGFVLYLSRDKQYKSVGGLNSTNTVIQRGLRFPDNNEGNIKTWTVFTVKVYTTTVNTVTSSAIDTRTISKCYNGDIFKTKNEDDGIFYIGELYAPDRGPLGITEYELANYTWLAASDIVPLDSSKEVELFGDTYFQRYDCLKTYPSTDEDVNQVVDIASFMVETYINIDGRYDRNRGLQSNLNITRTNFNLLNKAYTQNDKFVQSYVLKNDGKVTRFPNTIEWSLTKTYGELIDSWTHLTSTSVLDLDGNKGNLTKILNWRNTLLFFQDKGLGIIKYNENAALASNTGIPIELSNTGKVDGKMYYNDIIGCSNKWSIALSKLACYFIDSNTKTIYQMTDAQSLSNPKALSDNAFDSYLNNQDISLEQSFYNKDKQDVYFTFNDNKLAGCLTFNELSLTFTSFYDYTPEFIININKDCIHLTNEETESFLWRLNTGLYNYFYVHDNNDVSNLSDADLINCYSPFYFSVVSNGDKNEATLDKIFNNLEFRSDTWNELGELQHFTTFDQLITENEYQHGIIQLTRTGRFTDTLSNKDYQGINIPSSLKKKFRIWRANFPRALYNVIDVDDWDKYEEIPDITPPEGTFDIEWENPSKSRDRIRNTWTYVTLRKNDPNVDKTILHDLLVYYFD